jgi:hypothetical protein
VDTEHSPTLDERAAMRAFLQRCEVRLSTMHRVATALLSGAGILVLLPAVERDAVLQVMRSLLAGPLTWSRGLLAAGVVLSIALALSVLWLVIVELTRFYFHANHVVHDGVEVFTPRFTLTGVRMASDEFGDATNAEYEHLHRSEAAVRLLVPANLRSRQRIDRQLAAYPGLLDATTGDDDLARADALFELAAARRRPLVEEVTKIEYGIVRHMLRLQIIVLRYVKALLVVVATAIATFACAAAVSAVSAQSHITVADQRWVSGVLQVWAPVVLIVVSAPVRWLDSLLRAEGAQRSAVARDHELTRLESVTIRIAGAAWVAGVVSSVLLLVHHPITAQGRVAMVGTFIVSCVLAIVWLVRRITSRHEGALR